MNNTQPLSKRSKRILEEATRHLSFAYRGLTRLSIGEYRELTGFCGRLAVPFELSERLAGAEYLSKAIVAYLAER